MAQEDFIKAYECLREKVDVRDRSYKGQTYPLCFVGSEATDVLETGRSRSEAIEVQQTELAKPTALGKMTPMQLTPPQVHDSTAAVTPNIATLRVGNKLLERGYFHHVLHEHKFKVCRYLTGNLYSSYLFGFFYTGIARLMNSIQEMTMFSHITYRTAIFSTVSEKMRGKYMASESLQQRSCILR